MPAVKKAKANKPKISDYDVIIGIDTGVNTGFAAWDRKNKNFLQLDTVFIHKALERVSNVLLNSNYRLFVRVEDARLATFGRGDRANMSKAQGAGSVKRDAKIWEDFLTDCGIPFELVRPAMRKKKLTSAEFKKITGWTAPTNQHGRDAAMLVYGL